MNKTILGLMLSVTVITGAVTFSIRSGMNYVAELMDVKILDRPSVPESSTDAKLPANVTRKILKTVVVSKKRLLEIKEQIDDPSERFVGLITELSKDSKEPIFILLDSPGGSVLVGEKILTAIESSDAPVYTVCVGMCASMAAVIHQHGVKRYALDRSVLMFHDASGGMFGKLSEMKSLLSMFQRKLDKTNTYIASRAGLKLEEFKQLQSNNLWIDAEDAKEKRFVDDLVRLKVNE